ncbi:MAG: tetratricopeptide repeat protein [Anaerolineales bacterium]|nr:tetratricopeptide repeat protein [Anaerolineales bacterium]
MTEAQLQELQNLLTNGNSAAWDQKWNDAAVYYQQALEIDPKNFKALTNLGLAYYEMKEYHDALKAYGNAVELNGEDPAPYEKMFLIYKEMGQPAEAVKSALYAAESHLKNEDIQKAIENWKRVIDLDIQNIKAHARLGMVYERLGKNKLAVSEYINAASLLQLSGNTDTASESIDRALLCSPENIIALRAKEILHQGRQLPLPEPVVKEPEEKIQLDVPQLVAPKQPVPKVYDNPIVEAVDQAMIILAEALFEEHIFGKGAKSNQQRDLDSALSWNIDSNKDLTDDSLMKLHVSNAIENFSAGNEKEAAEHIKAAVEDGYNNPAAFFLLGYLYTKLNRMESATRSLNKAVSHENFALASRLLLADYFSSTEQWVEASKEYLEALRIADTSLVDKEDVEDLIHLYEVMMDDLEQQEGDEAFIEMSKHIEEMLLRSDWREILTELRAKGRAEDGVLLPQMDALLDDRRSQIMGVHKSIMDLTEEGHYGAAMEKAFFALQNAPSFLPLHVTIGDILMKQNKVSGAVTKYLAVADVYTVQGKTERALTMLKKVISLQPMNIEIRQRQIDLLEEYGNKEEAINEYINLADVFFPLAELDSARSAYTKALTLANTIADDGGFRLKLLLRLADLDIQRLDWDSAIATFMEISEFIPGHKKASISIVDLNYRLGKKPAAESEMDRFLNLYDPQTNGEAIRDYLVTLKEEIKGEDYIFRRLVNFYKDQGQRDQAITELDGLGEMLLDAGRKQDAVAVIEEIITLDPPNIEAYEKLLGQLRA